MFTLKEQKLQQLFIEIDSMLEDAKFQGMESPRYWYADDRITAIMEYCQEYLTGLEEVRDEA